MIVATDIPKFNSKFYWTPIICYKAIQWLGTICRTVTHRIMTKHKHLWWVLHFLIDILSVIIFSVNGFCFFTFTLDLTDIINLSENCLIYWVRVKQHIRSPFPWTYFPLIFCFAWYQQAGRVGQAETERKFVGVSGKRIRDFTPSLIYSPLSLWWKHIDVMVVNMMNPWF